MFNPNATWKRTSADLSFRGKRAGKGSTYDSVKNIFVGSGLINVTSKLVGPQTARAGIYAQPLNLIITGAGSSALGISGQKDLVSAGLKIGGSRLISTQIEPMVSVALSRPLAPARDLLAGAG